MNTLAADSPSRVFVVARSEPSKLLRLGMFLCFTLPGAWLVGTCGTLMVTVTAGQRDPSFFCLLGLLVVLGAGLVLYGMRTVNEPLLLLVFVPMPILISLGYRLGYLGHDVGFLVTVLGIVWPMIAYRSVSRHYKRLATKVAAAVRPEQTGAASTAAERPDKILS